MANNILERLDSLVPLFFLPTDVIDSAEREIAHRKITDRSIELETYEVSVNAALSSFFPKYKDSCRLVIESLAYRKHPEGIRVKLLDVFTVLALSIDVPVNVKLRYLYNWFNYGKNQTMTEFEFVAFLMKVNSCMTRLGIIGSIDLTMDDAKHYAFLARVYEDHSGEVKFHTYISFEEFEQFFRNHQLGKSFNLFFETLRRLALTMSTLQTKLNELHKITSQQLHPDVLSCQHVPRMDMFSLRVVDSPIIVIGRDANSVNFAFNACKEPYPNEMFEIYAQCDKYVKFENDTLFDLPRELQDQKDSLLSQRYLPKCCDRFFKVTVYRKSMTRVNADHNMANFVIKSLEPDEKYTITLYSRHCRYPSVSLTTPSYRNHEIVDKSEVQPNEYQKKHQVLIMPNLEEENACSYISALLKYLRGSNESAHSLLVFVRLDFDRIARDVQDYLYCHRSLFNEDRHMLLASMNPIIRNSFQEHFVHDITKLYQTVQGGQSINGIDWVSEVLDQQLFLLPSVQLWTDSKENKRMKERFTDSEIACVNQIFLDCYREFSRTFLCPKSFVVAGDVLFIFLGNSPGLCTRSDLKIAINDVLLSEITRSDNLARSIFRAKKIVIIADSTRDFISLAQSDRSDSLTPKIAEIAKSDEVTTPIKLRGKYELLHGEYTENSILPQNVPQKNLKSEISNSKWARDEIFAELLDRCMTLVGHGKEISILLTGLAPFSSIEIVGSVGKVAMECLNEAQVISHESLATMSAIEISLPVGATMSKTTLGSRRAVSITSHFHDMTRSLPWPRLSSTNSNVVKTSSVASTNTASTDLNNPADTLDNTEPIGRISALHDFPILATALRLVSVSDSVVVVSARTIGRGRLTCTVFEVPPLVVDLASAVALLSSGKDDAGLRVVSRQRSHLSVHGLDATFRFDGLQAFTSYLVSVEPFRGEPLCCLLRTDPYPDSPLQSLIIAPLKINDAPFCYLTMQKVAERISAFRSPTYRAVIIDIPFQRELDRCRAEKNRLYINRQVQHLSCAAHLIYSSSSRSSRDATTSRGGMETQFEIPSVSVSRSGRFCQIVLCEDTALALDGLVEAVEGLIRDTELKHLTVIVRKPLIRYLRKSQDGKYYHEDDSPYALNAPAVRRFCRIILTWKLQDPHRDCVVISVDHVPQTRCIMISHRTMRSYETRRLSVDMSAVGEASLAMDFSIASIHDDQSFASTTIPIPDEVRQTVYDMISEVERRSQTSTIRDRMTQMISSLPWSRSRTSTADSAMLNVAAPAPVVTTQGKVQNLAQTDLSLVEEEASLSLQSGSVISGTLPHGRRIHEFSMSSFRHIILPATYQDPEMDKKYIFEQRKNMDKALVFPAGVVSLGLGVQFELLDEVTSHYERIVIQPPRLEFYGKYRDLLTQGPVVYSMDVVTDEIHFIDPKADPKVSSSDLAACLAPVHPASTTTASSTFHTLVVKTQLHDIDDLQVLCGPLVGVVTQTTALLGVEVNRRLRFLQMIAKPVGFDVPSVSMTRTKIKAFKFTVFKFEKLHPGVVYEVFCPVLRGRSIAVKFQTIPRKPTFIEFLFTGRALLGNVPMIDHIVQQFLGQQSPVYRHLQLITDYIYGMKSTLPSDNDYIFQSAKNAVRTAEHDNAWIKYANEVRSIGSSTIAAVHLDSVSILTHSLRTILSRILKHVVRLELPLRDASAVGSMYFYHLEEAIKDTFRLVFSIPMIREAFASTATQFLFNSSYLLPLEDELIDPDILKGSHEDCKKLMQVIRKLFEAQMMAYIGSIAHFDNELGHHTKVWRCDSVAMILLDTTTGRSKSKKKKDMNISESAKESQKEETAADADVPDDIELETESTKGFSHGFIDMGQWKYIKNLTLDNSILQLILFTEKPILSCYGVPMRPILDEGLSTKGQTFPWAPCFSDLNNFYQHWISWMMPKGPMERLHKSIMFVSMSDRPYTSIIQDISTGVKMHQICLGNFDGIAQHHASVENTVDDSELVLAGKIGKFRYINTMGLMNLMQFDSSRDETLQFVMNNFARHRESGLSQSGFGKMRLWIDSWKAKSIYSSISTDLVPKKRSKSIDANASNARVLVGPILGIPRIQENGKEEHCFVPVMYEVDSPTTVVFQVKEIFTGTSFNISCEANAHKPFVVKIGPLKMESRFRVKAISGFISSPYNDFVVSSFINWSESNIAFLNCDPPMEGTVMSSDFLQDLIKRAKVPFSGLTGVAHLNTAPDLRETVRSIEKSTQISGEILSCKKNKTLSKYIMDYLEYLMEALRQQYRATLTRPSYREVLGIAYNIFMPTKSPLDYSDINPQEQRGTIRHLLYLMVARLNQEYFDQINFPDDDVFIARVHSNELPHLKDDNAWGDVGKDPKEDQSIGGESFVFHANPDKESIQSLFMQWLREMTPLPAFWKPWIVPNGRAVVELAPTLSDVTFSEVVTSLADDSIGIGIRLIVTCDDPSGQSIDFLTSTSNGGKVEQAAWHWIGNYPHRQVAFIVPSRARGTKQLVMDQANNGQMSLVSLDTFNRNNEYERLLKVLSNETVERVVATASSGGKSKKAKLKREAELKAKMEVKQKELMDMLARQIPDGYVIAECRTSLIHSKDGHDDVISTFAFRVIPSVYNGDDKDLLVGSQSSVDIPSPYDYLQLPEWLIKFFPNRQGLFIQDEVVFVVRSDPETRLALAPVETDELIIQIMELYEKSRISELSRPEELREVNMDIPGVIAIFIRDLVDKVWEQVVPPDIKPAMVDISDDFIRSMLLSRTLPDLESISSSDAFARGMQQMLFFAICIKLSFKMKDMAKWKYIMEEGDEAAMSVKRQTKRDKILSEVRAKGIQQDPEWDDDTIQKIFKERDAQIDVESDVEELEREKLELEEYMERKDQEEEDARIRAEEEAERAAEKQAKREAEHEKNANLTDEELVTLMNENEQTGRDTVEAILQLMIDEVYDKAVPLIIQEAIESDEAELTAAAAKLIKPLSEEERVAESLQHMRKLASERINVRTRWGQRLTFLSGL